MGMNYNNKGKFAIAEDGTIKRPYNELDEAMLNIMRVGASKDDILAAYKAREKCYQLCKESAKRPDYKEYVETLQLDNFPNELKKADYGKRYVILVSCLALCVVVIICFVTGLFVLCIFTYFEAILIGLASIAVIAIVSKFIVKKLTDISQTIKSIKSV